MTTKDHLIGFSAGKQRTSLRETQHWSLGNIILRCFSTVLCFLFLFRYHLGEEFYYILFIYTLLVSLHSN